MSFYSRSARNASSFQIISDSMLQFRSATSPRAKRLPEHLIVSTWISEEAVYTPTLVLWALVSQAFFKGEQRSCNAAVTRIAAWWAAQSRVVDDTNSGAYCRASMKPPFERIAYRVCTIADRAEQSSDLAEPAEQE